MREKDIEIITACLDRDMELSKEKMEAHELAVKYIERGREEGRLDEKHRILNVMLNLQMDPKIISKCTDIPVEMIKDMTVIDFKNYDILEEDI